MITLTLYAKSGTWHMTGTRPNGTVWFSDIDTGLTMIVQPKRLPKVLRSCGFSATEYIIVIA